MVKSFPNRGEVWICNFGGETGRRPVAVVSDDTLNEVREKVIVALGTTNKRNIPTEVPVGKEEGLSQAGVICASDLYTVPKQFLVRRSGVLNKKKMTQLDKALQITLSLPY